MHQAVCRSVNQGATWPARTYKATHPAASPTQVKTVLQDAGDLGWNDADDPDSTKERLLNVDAL